MSLTDLPVPWQIRLPGLPLVSLRDRPAARIGPQTTTLLIHGYTDSGESFGPLAPHLNGRLLIPDLPGHGDSAALDQMTLESMADALAVMLDVLGCGPVQVLGHSMGALIAMHLALRHPGKVAGLTLISASLRPEGPEMAALATQIANLPDPLAPDDGFFAEWHRCPHPVPPGMLARLARSAAAMRRADWLAMLAALRRADLTTAVKGLHCPVQIIAGGLDPIFPPQHAKELARALPQAQTHWMPDHGHNPHWEAPEQVAALIG